MLFTDYTQTNAIRIFRHRDNLPDLFSLGKHEYPFFLNVQSIVKHESRKAGLTRKVRSHTLNHSFTTYLPNNGTDVHFIQELLMHKDIRTSLIDTQVTNRSLSSIQSPLDQFKLGERFDNNPKE